MSYCSFHALVLVFRNSNLDELQMQNAFVPVLEPVDAKLKPSLELTKTSTS